MTEKRLLKLLLSVDKLSFPTILVSNSAEPEVKAAPAIAIAMMIKLTANDFDSNGTYKEVEGEGVVGMQPSLAPGESYQYVSGCNLNTEMGRMNGTYQMENLHSKKMFEVSIPSFEMIVPMKNN